MTVGIYFEIGGDGKAEEVGIFGWAERGLEGRGIAFFCGRSTFEE
jgi:hypothetical protein